MAIDTSKLMKSSLGLIGSGIGAYTNLSPIEDVEQYINQAQQLGNSNYQLGSLQGLADQYALQIIPQQLTGNDLYNPSAGERFGQLFGSGLLGFQAGYNFADNFTGDMGGISYAKKTPQMKEDYLGAFSPKEYAEGGGLSLSYGSMVNAAAGLGMAGINMGLNAIGNAQRRKQAAQDALRYNALRDFSIDRNTLDFQRAIDDSTDNMFNMQALQMKANGGKIYIKPSKRGTFTAAAKSRGMGVQEFASKVLANKENYSTNMVKKANFARNAAKWHDEGGPLFTNGGIWSNGLTFIGNGGTHEENPFEGVPMGIAPDGIPNLVEEGEVIYNDYVFSDRLKISKKMLDKYMLPSKYEGKSYAEVSKELSKESEERPNDPISKKGLEDSIVKLQQAQEEYKAEKDRNKLNTSFKNGGMLEHKFFKGGDKDPFLETGLDLAHAAVQAELEQIRQNAAQEVARIQQRESDILSGKEKVKLGPSLLAKDITSGGVSDSQISSYKKSKENKNNKQPKDFDSFNFSPNSLLRYTPTLIQGIQALKGNKVDYTNPNLIAANTKSINFTPLGDYMALERLPFVSTIGNKMQAQQAATNAAIMNAAANRAAAIPSLITSGYKGQTALADAALEASKYNNLLAQAEAEFNRGTNQANLTAGLQTASANQQTALDSAYKQAAMRELIDQYISESNSTNATTLLDNIQNIGREMDAIREAKKTMAANAAYGGKLNKRKKKGLTC